MMADNTSDAARGRHGRFDAVIVGAGFSGLYLLYRFRQMGLTAKVIDIADEVGGTWYWNRYPGARCDAMSALYSFSFSEEIQQEWSWSEKYARQPEILAYLQFVADRLDLRRDIWFGTRVEAARYDEAAHDWAISTDRGDELRARYCIMATGCLSAGRLPDIPGAESTALRTYHTGAWPHHEVDFTGKRVGVIGTGSSGVQLIPEIARQAAELVVYQRSPNFVVPAGNAPTGRDEEAYLKANYPAIREAWRRGELVGAGEELKPGNLYRSQIRAMDVSAQERDREYERRWNRGGAAFNAAFGDIMLDAEANSTSADFVRRKIRSIVKDPELAETLTPRDHPIGAKRICVHDGYYDTYNRPNVTLVDLRKDPIERITDKGVVTRSGERAFDALVFATGFDAMTGALLRMDITGRDGLALSRKWEAGPVTYLGVALHGFPNLFLITGPGSPSVLGNVVNHIEQHVDFVTDLIAQAERAGAAAVECTAQVEDQWVRHVSEVAQGTLYLEANSWYVGANVPGKPRVLMPYVGGIARYRETCEQIAAAGFEGFTFDVSDGAAAQAV